MWIVLETSTEEIQLHWGEAHHHDGVGMLAVDGDLKWACRASVDATLLKKDVLTLLNLSRGFLKIDVENKGWHF